MACKKAIVEAENECWNCKGVLDDSLEIKLNIKAGSDLYQYFAEFKRLLDTSTDSDVLVAMLKLNNIILKMKRDGVLPEEIRSFLAGIKENVSTATGDDKDASIFAGVEDRSHKSN